MSTHWFMYRHYDTDLDVLVFEAEFDVEVSARIIDGDLQTEVTDVSIEGRSLFAGSAETIELAKKIRQAATEELDSAGLLWDRVKNDLELYHTEERGWRRAS